MKKCRTCNGEKFDDVLDMGKNPLVNSLIEKEDLDKAEEQFPLKLVRCRDCGLVQVEKPIDAHKIYKDVDYLYFSSDMPNLKQYFEEYAQELIDRFETAGEFVVEIGSNDGIMLDMFPLSKVLGIDPATNVAIRALRKGIPTLPLFFNERVAKLVRAEYGPAKIVYANNCIAHIDDLDSVMRGVEHLLMSDGVFVVECNYWGGMVKNTNYALVYHDHFSYFSLKNWVDYAKKFGLEVFDATVTPAQGGSLRVFMTKGNRAKTKRFHELQQEEVEKGINTLEVAQKYGESCCIEAERLYITVAGLKLRGKKIAGYGAAAKGFSVLKLARITEEHIDFFVDDSPAKQGKYTPVSHIPVRARADIKKGGLPDVFFITAPNYAETIMEKEAQFKKDGGQFLLCDSTLI